MKKGLWPLFGWRLKSEAREKQGKTGDGKTGQNRGQTTVSRGSEELMMVGFQLKLHPRFSAGRWVAI